MKKLVNKKVVITGGAGSIGQTTAKLFLDHGAKVMLVDNDEEALRKVVDELGNSDVFYCVADVTRTDDVKNYTQHVQKIFGKADVFFNNAGIEGVVNPITDYYSEDIFVKVMGVNVKGVWLGSKYMVPMMKDGSSIILSSSLAGIGGTSTVSDDMISKHAVIGIMNKLALELASRRIKVNTIKLTLEPAPRNIRVNTIYPSQTENILNQSLKGGCVPDHEYEDKKGFEAKYAKLQEIAALVLSLASDENQFITGTTKIIKGCTPA